MNGVCLQRTTVSCFISGMTTTQAVKPDRPEPIGQRPLNTNSFTMVVHMVVLTFRFAVNAHNNCFLLNKDKEGTQFSSYRKLSTYVCFCIREVFKISIRT